MANSMNINQEITELRVRVKALEARVKNNNEALAALRRASSGAVERIAALEAGATCPHIVSTDEGTSYCDLAEQTAAAQLASAAALEPAGGAGGEDDECAGALRRWNGPRRDPRGGGVVAGSPRMGTRRPRARAGGRPMTDHPIVPPPELIQEWENKYELHMPEWIIRHVAYEAAKWGADQELEACLRLVEIEVCEGAYEVSRVIRAARRPKQTSPKQQAPADSKVGELPPRPPLMEPPAHPALERYGITWDGSPDKPLLTRRADGYWTPWHVAADLLERQQLVPVAVSERLPAMVTDGLRVAGDCDEQGRCWAGTRASVDTSGDRDIDLPPSWELREVCAQDDVWLPAHALPVPSDVVEG